MVLVHVVPHRGAALESAGSAERECLLDRCRGEAVDPSDALAVVEEDEQVVLLRTNADLPRAAQVAADVQGRVLLEGEAGRVDEDPLAVHPVVELEVVTLRGIEGVDHRLHTELQDPPERVLDVVRPVLQSSCVRRLLRQELVLAGERVDPEEVRERVVVQGLRGRDRLVVEVRVPPAHDVAGRGRQLVFLSPGEHRPAEVLGLRGSGEGDQAELAGADSLRLGDAAGDILVSVQELLMGDLGGAGTEHQAPSELTWASSRLNASTGWTYRSRVMGK